MERILTLERLLKKVSELFGHADFIAVELMLERVRLCMTGSVISEESYKALRAFFGAGLAQFPEEMPFRSFATERRDAGFRAMTAWLDSFWHRATSNDFGDIFIFCDACYEKRPDKELFFWWLADEMCDACGLCTHEDRCLHCGETTSSYMRFAVPHFDGKIGYGVEGSKFLGMRDIKTHGSLARAGKLLSVARDLHGASSHGARTDSNESRSWDGSVERHLYSEKKVSRRPRHPLGGTPEKIYAALAQATREFIEEMRSFVSEEIPGAAEELRRLEAQLARLAP